MRNTKGDRHHCGLVLASGTCSVIRPLAGSWAAGMTATAEEAVRNAHEWFEVNSGWAPPDEETLAEWDAEGVCRSPDDCLVAPDGWCNHGLASWRLILTALD